MVDAGFGIPAVTSVLPGTYTVDTLPTAGAANLGKRAQVTDLFGVKGGQVVCSQSGATFYWEPDCASPNGAATADQTMTLVTLKSPTVMLLNGTLTASRTVTLSPTNAYPGATFRIKTNISLGVFGLSLQGLSTGALALLANSDVQAIFDGSAWKQVNS